MSTALLPCRMSLLLVSTRSTEMYYTTQSSCYHTHPEVRFRSYRAIVERLLLHSSTRAHEAPLGADLEDIQHPRKVEKDSDTVDEDKGPARTHTVEHEGRHEGW